MDPPYIFSLTRCHSPSSLQLVFVVFAFEAALTGLEFNLVGKASLELTEFPLSLIVPTCLRLFTLQRQSYLRFNVLLP